MKMTKFKLYCWICGCNFEYDTENNNIKFKPKTLREMFCPACASNSVHLTSREEYLNKIKELEKEDVKFEETMKII